MHPNFKRSARHASRWGVVDAWTWAREPKALEGKCTGVKKSVRRCEGWARVAGLAAELSQTRLLYVAGREPDVRELMVRASDLGTPADWLLLSRHNRVLPDGGRLWAKVLTSPALGEIRFTLEGRRGRMAGKSCQKLYGQRASLSDGRRGTFEVTCLVAPRSVDGRGSSQSNGAC